MAAVLLMFTACEKDHGAPAAAKPSLPTAQVRVKTAENKLQTTTEEVVGTVRPKLHATLEARLSGRIDKMPVLLGQTVKAGQLVARLDAAEIKARLDQAQAALEQAESDWKRISSLFESGTITRSEYDAADARQRVARAATAEAKAMMGYVEILAPFDGVVTKKWTDVGDLATPGKPLLELEDPSALQLDADVPEAIASRIQRGARLAVRSDSIPDETIAVVSEVAPAADPISRTLRVKLDLPNPPAGSGDSTPYSPLPTPDSALASASPTPHSALPTPHFLRSGQFARLVVPIGESASLRVPASAVLERGQLEIAFVIGNQCAQLHLVKTGKRVGDELEILAGLDAGDQVVIDGAALLADGQRVEVK